MPCRPMTRTFRRASEAAGNSSRGQEPTTGGYVGNARAEAGAGCQAHVRGPRGKVPGHTFPHGRPRASLHETHPTAALPGEAA